MKTKRENTAYHEAGHATAFIITSKNFDHVTIKPYDIKETAGNLHYMETGNLHYMENIPFLDLKIEYLTLECFRILAGPISQKIFSGKSIWGSGPDMLQVHKTIAACIKGEKSKQLFWNFIISYTNDIIKDNWLLIEANANKLIEKESLTFQEVCEISQKFTE